MKMNVLLCTLVFCSFVVSCTNRPKQEKTQQAPINNAVGINDTLGISLHPEYTVYSTKQKQITFVLHNNSGTDIGFGGYYSCTYEDEKGIWRDVPMQLVVFDVEYVLMQGDKYYYNAELFKHTPGHYRFFLTIRRYSRKYTLMTEFQLQDNMVELFKRHPYSQVNDTLLPPEEEVVYPPIIIDKEGYIIEPNIVRSVEPSLDREALRLIKMLPQWKPGTLKGKAVKVKYTVPVAFKLK